MQHSTIDQRSLELDRIVIRRLRENPALVGTAQATLQRWLSTSSQNVRPDLLKWQGLLDGDFAALLHFLGSATAESTRLRQSSPFAGTAFITRKERDEVFGRYRDQAASAAPGGRRSPPRRPGCGPARYPSGSGHRAPPPSPDRVTHAVFPSGKMRP